MAIGCRGPQWILVATITACTAVTGCGSDGGVGTTTADGGPDGAAGFDAGGAGDDGSSATDDASSGSSSGPGSGGDSGSGSTSGSRSGGDSGSTSGSGSGSGGDSGSGSSSGSGGVDAGDGGAGCGCHATTSGPLQVDHGSVDFSYGSCGGNAVTQAITVTNHGGTTLVVGVAVTGSAFGANTTSLSIPAGTSQTLTLTAQVSSHATAGTALTGDVILTADDPAADRLDVGLSVVPLGATLVFAQPATTFSFPTTAVGSAATPIALGLTNTGNAAAAFTFGAALPAGPFSLAEDFASPVLLDPGFTLTATAGFTPAAPGAVAATGTITVQGTVCGPSVDALFLFGAGDSQ